MEQDIRIVELKPEAAASFLEVQLQLDRESCFMMLEPGEREENSSHTEKMIRKMNENGSVILAAEVDGKLLGYLSAERGTFQRISHVAYIVIGILKDYQNRGIGKKLFAAVEKWAVRNDVTRLELTVMCRNEAAVHLYKTCGFEIEGCKKRTMRIDGVYIDEYMMAKYL